MSRVKRTGVGFSSEEQTITKAKKPLNIVAKEIELENSSEYIIKTTEQKIEGRKNFETPQPAEVSTANATGSAIPVIIKSGPGGNTSFAGTVGTGGGTGRIEVATGEGGQAPNATTTSKGGPSGEINFTVGPGGAALGVGQKNEGGLANKVVLQGNTGGRAAGASTVSNKGGAGSEYKAAAGAGGEAANSLGVNTGGNAGLISFAGRAGGVGKGGTKATGGTGSTVEFRTGPGGNASLGSETNTNGSAGKMLFILSEGGGGEEAKSSPFEVRYKAEAGALRFYIHPEGNIGIGNTSTPKAKLEVLGTTTSEGLLTAKGGLTVEGTLKLPSEASTLKVAAPTAIAEYTSAKEEEEAKATFITLVIVVKAEAAAATVKLVNSGEEISFKWDGVALGAQRVPLTLMVKKAGKWKATLEGSAEKAEISRVSMEP